MGGVPISVFTAIRGNKRSLQPSREHAACLVSLGFLEFSNQNDKGRSVWRPSELQDRERMGTRKDV